METVYSVSAVTRYIKTLYEGDGNLHNISVSGEISNFKRYSSGHCYFTLKDAGAAMKCVMFRGRAQSLKFEPADGMKVVAVGNISVYERDGVYQLYAERLLPDGVGELSQAYEQLKKRLAEEGLFAEERKQKLPFFPQTVGVVTSLSGAVLRDIYRVSKRRNPQIKLVLYPVQVQGEGAAEKIAAAIRFFNERYPVDVIIAGRGGGSIEDLWCFNEESVVRAIAASKIPLISAVGHETDFTLADFAADVRAATPSQAAELAVPDCAALSRHLESLVIRLRAAGRKVVDERRHRLAAVMSSRIMIKPHLLLVEPRQELDMLQEKLARLKDVQLEQKKNELAVLARKLELLNPLAVLRRGYCIAEGEKGVLHSVADVSEGDLVEGILLDGRFTARVENVVKGKIDHAAKKDV